jgi:GTPase SAR1 family protein
VEERVVPMEEGQNMANKLGMGYIEVSVRDDKNVNKSFEMIARSICQSLF